MTTQALTRYIFFALVTLLLAIYTEYTGIDMWIAHHFYDPVDQSWPLRSQFVTKTLLHDYAQTMVKILGVATLIMLLLSRVSKQLVAYRQPLAYLFLASFTGPLIVVLIKSLTHIHTPWELAEFGGDLPYVRLFDSVGEQLPIGYAFPGGHSSAGFAFFSLYFLLYFYAPRYKYYGLAIPLMLGLIFGIDQEIRGAHFFSHDLMSLFICWSSALFWAWFYLQKQVSDPATNRLIEDRQRF